VLVEGLIDAALVGPAGPPPERISAVSSLLLPLVFRALPATAPGALGFLGSWPVWIALQPLVQTWPVASVVPRTSFLPYC